MKYLNVTMSLGSKELRIAYVNKNFLNLLPEIVDKSLPRHIRQIHTYFGKNQFII